MVHSPELGSPITPNLGKGHEVVTNREEGVLCNEFSESSHAVLTPGFRGLDSVERERDSKDRDGEQRGGDGVQGGRRYLVEGGLEHVLHVEVVFYFKHFNSYRSIMMIF